MAVVRVSDEGRDLIRAFARHHGVTISALLEAIAQNLPTDDELNDVHHRTLEEARAIMVERLARD